MHASPRPSPWSPDHLLLTTQALYLLHERCILVRRLRTSPRCQVSNTSLLPSDTDNTDLAHFRSRCGFQFPLSGQGIVTNAESYPRSKPPSLSPSLRSQQIFQILPNPRTYRHFLGCDRRYSRRKQILHHISRHTALHSFGISLVQIPRLLPRYLPVRILHKLFDYCSS